MGEREKAEMNCTGCFHDHLDPRTGELNPDRCFGTDEDGDPCRCQDFDF